MNTNLHKETSSKFEQSLYKLMINAIFGKTMENVRKYTIFKFVRKWDGVYDAKSLIAKPNFHSLTIFDQNFVAI